jgi:solute carrier family 25 protein 42
MAIEEKGHSILGQVGKDASSGSAQDNKAPLKLQSLLICGAIAGATAKTVTAPIDRVKILYQVNAERAFTLAKAAKTTTKIFNNTGIAGLWRGNMASMYRVIPYSAISFTCFDEFHTGVQLFIISEGWQSR